MPIAINAIPPARKTRGPVLSTQPLSRVPRGAYGLWQATLAFPDGCRVTATGWTEKAAVVRAYAKSRGEPAPSA